MDCPHCGKALPVGVRFVLSKHGHAGKRGGVPSRTYLSWRGMIARCTQTSNPSFKHYRKLGIAVCQRWLEFKTFLADMGERPQGHYSLDRIDNAMGYNPKNCRWATKQEQANNRSTNRRFTYRGIAYTLADLSRVTGIPKGLLRSRLCRSKLPWTVEGAVRTPKLTRAQQGFSC